MVNLVKEDMKCRKAVKNPKMIDYTKQQAGC